MANDFRPFDRAAGRESSEPGFLEGARESFTQAFAYDHFQWPALKVFGSARPSVMEFRAPAERAAEERGLDSGDDHPAQLYTTTNSDIPIYMTGEVVPVDSDGMVTPQINVSGPVVGIDDFRNDARFDGIDGSGQAVVIIDSGIDLDDPFFGADANGNGVSDRIVYQYDFADNDANAGDLDGHGSNVASIAASSNATYTGMAPGADIIALKVFSDSGEGYFSDIEESLRWVIDNAAAYNIVSVNMSLGDSHNYNAPVGLYGIADELSILASMDVIVVSASGNDFYEFNSVQGVSYPSADPNSLSVGAVYDGNTGGWQYYSPDGSVGAIAYTTAADRIAPFSQRDDELTDIFAPGADIIGAGAGTGLVSMHGTSQAAPHVTGIVALAQQVAVEVLGRKLTFEEFSDLLSDSAAIIIDGDNENDNVANTGLAFPRVNVAKLGEAILDMAEPNSFSIAALSAAKAEGDSGSTAFTFTVTRSGYSGEAATVDYAVSGSAASATDFAGNVLPAGTVSFAAGQVTKAVTILVKGETLFESNESFTVNLSNPSGDGTIATGSANGTIVNDDAAPQPPAYAIAALDAAKAEGDAGSTAFTFTVTRTGDTAAAGAVDYAVSGALSGSDFAGGVLPSGTVGFAAGQTSRTLTLQLAGDALVEADEAFSVTLSNASGGGTIATPSADGTVFNDDAAAPGSAFAIVAADAEKSEGDAGSTAFTFTVTRSGDTGEAATVDYAVGGGAADGADFAGGLLPAGSLSFAAGETSKTLVLQVQGDALDEGDEGFTVTLSNPSGNATIATAAAEGRILDDEDQPAGNVVVLLQAGFDAGNDSEGFEYRDGLFGGGPFQRYASGDWEDQALRIQLGGSNNTIARNISGGWQTEFTLSEAAETHLSFVYDLSIGADYESNEYSQVLVSIDGGTPILVDQLTGDGNDGGEQTTGPRTFTLALGSLAAGSHSLEIGAFNNQKSWSNEASEIFIDDVLVTAESDAPPPPEPARFAIAADDAVKAEGDAGSTAFTFTVTRTGDTSAAGSVDYAVTGEAGSSDFAGGSLPGGTLTFLTGETSKTLTIEVAGDSGFEADEDFTVTLSNGSAGSEITVAAAEGTILNDDPAPPATFLSIAALEAVTVEGDAGVTAFTFTVTRSGDTSAAGSVDYAVTGAANGTDFVGGSLPGGTVVFAAGQISTTLTIEVAGDTAFEADEAFTVTLSNASAGSEIATASAEGTILNDDPAPPATFLSIAALDAVTAEGDAGATAFTFTVTRSGDTSAAGSVDYAVTGAANGADFVGGSLPGGTLSFAAGEASKTLTLQVAGDTAFEADEAFTVTLSNASTGSEITAASAGGTIQNDDPAPPAAFYEIAALDAAKAEGDSGDTLFTFTISRSGDLSFPASVSYSLAGAGASPADGADFAGGLFVLDTASFAEGQASVTIDIRVAGDTDFEPGEGFVVTIFDPTSNGAVVSGKDSAAGTILNDDPAPPATFLSIAALDAETAEGDAGSTAFTFTVTRSGDTSAAGSVDYAVTGAADGADFAGGSLPGGTLSFAAGELSKTLTIEVAGDSGFEADEDFTVTLSNASAGSDISVAAAEGTILNDDPAPPATFLSIAALDAEEAEGDAGSTAFTFTVTRTGDTSAAGSVDYAVSGAANGTDFVSGSLPSGTLSFAAGELSKTLTIEVAGDSGFEADEAFTVTLANASAGSEITVATAEGTIVNDDAAPPASFLAIAADDAAKAEGDAGSTAFTFTVTRSGDTSAAGSVDYAVSGAANGTDFVGGSLPGGTVVFAAGQISTTLTIEVAGDSGFEADEDFTVTLSNASTGSEIATASAAGTILNDDPAPPATFLSIAALDAVTAEGDAGSTAFTFTVTRTGDTSAAGSVDYAVTGEADGADFGGTLPSGTVVFAAGETSTTLTVEVAGDSGFEADEAFTVTLSNASAGSAITTASAAGTILNDDAAPPATFLAIAPADAAQPEGLIGETFLTFTVTRSGDTSVAGVVDYAVTGEVDGADFVGGLLPGGTLTFAAGEASKTLSFNVAGDGDEEPDEDFTVTLSNASAGSAILTASAGGTIENDDGPPEPPVESFLSVSAADAVKSEGDDGSTLFTFTVSRPGTIIGDASVDYTVTGSGSNPADAADFAGGILPSGTVTIQGEGASSATIVIAVAGDSGIEFDEGFTVTLSNPSAGAAIVDGSAEGVILDDDDDGGPADSIVLLAADFDSPGDTGGFAYSDGVFVALPFQNYASGSWEDQALTIDLGGRDTRIARNVAGAWESDFTLAEEMQVTLSFDYEMILSPGYDAGEFSRLLVSIDDGEAILIEELLASGEPTAADSVSLDLGSLGAGSHTLAIGGYINQKSWSDEFTEITLDDVLVTGTPPAGGAGLADAAGLPGPGNPGLSETELLATAGF